MEPQVDWLPPILILAAGLVVGAIALFVISRRSRALPDKSATGTPVTETLSDADLDLRDLEAKRDDLVLQLREMEDTASKLEPEQLAVERYEVELETAEVLREIDRLTGEVQAPATRRAATREAVEAAPEEETGPPGGIKGFVWGVASAAALGALVIFVVQSASERAEGGSVTGGPQMSGRSAQQAQDPDLERAIAAVDAHPDNVEMRVDLAYEYLLREQFMNVFEQTQIVLERNPSEPRALTYQALVRLAMGQGKVATDMLEKAVGIEPDLMDARVYLGLAYTQTGRFDEAMAQIDAAKKSHPDQAERLDQVATEFEMLKAQGGPPRDEAAEDPHASLLPPPPTGDGMTPARPAAPPPPGAVTGTLTLGDGVSVPRGTVVFVMVRAMGESGPPVAVARLNAGSWPMPFTVSSMNSMMGDALPDRMRIDVRVDLDGDVMTRDEGAPTGFVEGVASGASGITIQLR
jgi:tetratricopeptide (TPR) repeat protein